MATTTITVQNNAGTVLSGATISYTVSGVAIEGTTDTNGQLEVEGLTADTYAFTASLDGYTSATLINETDSTVTITLEGESTLSNITDAMKAIAETAATTAAATVVTTLANEALAELTNAEDESQSLIEKGVALVQKLTAEIGTTKNWFVKIRNEAEVVALTAILAGVGAGIPSAISELKSKLK